MTQPPDQLDYRDGKLDRPERSRVIAQFVGGIVIGLILMAIIGFFLAISTLSFGAPRSGNAGLRFTFAIAFAVVVMMAAIFSPISWRKRRFIIAGILCGIGASSLVEGICFLNG